MRQANSRWQRFCIIFILVFIGIGAIICFFESSDPVWKLPCYLLFAYYLFFRRVLNKPRDSPLMDICALIILLFCYSHSCVHKKNSTKFGERPHYHRRVTGPNGSTRPGQGIGRHRPWETKSSDKSFGDRF